ncbi:MAG: M42 family metallopeptidase [Candidatus Zixiibacteriota bacterium]
MAKKLTSFDKFMKKYTDAFGPSSFENDVAELFREDAKPFANNITRCGIGSIIAEKKGSANAPKIMVAGHMDEIGFMVKGITKQNYLKVNNLGGWWTHNLVGQKVIVRTSSGKEIIGVFGSKAPHSLEPEERKKVMKLENLYVDVGVTEDDEDYLKKELGIRVGDPIVPLSDYHKMGKDGKMLMAKAWDNRIGVIAALKVLENLSKNDHPNSYYAVGTVQEEVGLRGAGTSAYVVDPDIAFAVDVTLASDIPGAKDSEWAEKLGKGPSISVMDGSLTPNPRLRDFVIDIAEENNIPYQLGSLTKGGTDGGRIAQTRGGTPTLTLSISTRYIHAHNGILHNDDVENLIKLLTAVIKKLDKKAVEKIRYK